MAPVFTDFKEGISFCFRVVYLDSSPLLWMDAQEFGVQSSHWYPHAESKEGPLHWATDEMWHPLQPVSGPIQRLTPASVPCALCTGPRSVPEAQAPLPQDLRTHHPFARLPFPESPQSSCPSPPKLYPPQTSLPIPACYSTLLLWWWWWSW